MSFDSFKSSILGPEALAARIEHEKKLKEERERARAERLQREAKRKDSLEFNLAVSREYEGEESWTATGVLKNQSGPKLSRAAGAQSLLSGDRLQIDQNGKKDGKKAQVKDGGPAQFKLRRFNSFE